MEIGLFLFLGVISRFLPHAPNFAPIGALILHSSKKRVLTGVIVAVLVMIISDTLLGFSFASPFVYIGMASYALFGKLIGKRFGLIAAPVLGSILFFLISNFGVWLGPWYDHGLAGLVRCYSLAIPFYQNTLLSDVAFTVGIYVFAIIVKAVKLKGGLWQQNYLKMILRKR